MDDKGNKPVYSIDDILTELAANQQRRRQDKPAAPPPEPAPLHMPPDFSRTPPVRSAETKPAEVLYREEDGDAPEEKPRRLSFLSRRRKREADEAAWQALSAPKEPEISGLPPRPDAVKPAQPQKADSVTRVLDMPEPAAPAEPPEEKPPASRARVPQAAAPIPGGAAPDREGPMKPGGFAEESGKPAAAHTEPDAGGGLEAQLQKARQEKVAEFQRLRDSHPLDFKLAGDEEEDNDPSEEPEVYEEEELEDYGDPSQTAAVHNELSYRRRTGWIDCLLTLTLELVLVWLALTTHFTGAPPMETYLYIGLNAFLLLFMMLVNHRMVGGGLAALGRLRADGDSAASLASLAALVHTLVQFLRPDGVSSGLLELLAPAAGLSLLLGALGRQARVLRVCANFRFISYPGEKFEAKKIDDARQAEEIGRPAVALGEPQVAYFKPASFLSRFLENSYAPDGSEAVMRVFLPFLLLACALLGAGFGLMRGDWWMALTVFASTVCLGTPAAMSAVHFPLLRAAKSALARGGMISGWNAVKTFGHLHGAVVDAADLFPSESVLLHGIKTFSGARIDEAILDAAAVSVKAGGPLAAVFRRVIEDKLDILPPVDSLVYEQDMGLSGWVGGRRVLVGNRRLLENHGVDVPSRDYELRYTRNGRRLAYLSTAGELTAMFVVSYTADDGIIDALHCLEKSHITLLVRTCDPNVTEELICNTLEIDAYYVEIMSNAAGRTCSDIIDGTAAETPAVLASNGRIEGTAAALAGCRRLRVGAGLGLGAQIAAAGLGVALSAVLAFHSHMVLPAVYTLAYLLVSAVLSWILPCVKRI